MNYDEQEQWVRNKICKKKRFKMKPGFFPNEIISTIEPTDEDVQLNDEWICELYWFDKNIWSIEIVEKSSNTVFILYIILKTKNP